jgi:hypothetical protein
MYDKFRSLQKKVYVMNLTHILILCHLILFQKHIILEASAASIIQNKYAGDVAKKWDKE